MPQAKLCFARLAPIDASQATSISQRLPKLAFEQGQGSRVIAVERAGERVSIELVTRRLREGRRYDESSNKMVSEQVAVDRAMHFSVDFASGLAETSGSRRDISLLVDALTRAGASSETAAQPIILDLSTWIKDMLRMYESAQLAGMVVDGFFVEPRLIGRYSAKTMDNRIDMDFIDQKAASLRSLRLSFFFEGLRRSVEARADGTLVVQSGEEEDLEDFLSEQRKLFLKHSAG
ncbi:hypothetical protein IT575_05305 [bacterium]|nr:hypothetical protein [bacterium]